MKRILFPTDFSEVATNAFEYALEFANKVQGELMVLHSYDLIPMDDQFFPENFNEIYDSVELANFEQFKEEIPKLRAIMENHQMEHIKMTHRLMEGDLRANIKKSIQEDKIDYLVMGTSGVSEWEALFAGSNSGSVILGLEIPMFCVPSGVKFKNIKTIGYVNHYTAKDKETLGVVLDMAKMINATVKSLYVRTHKSEIDAGTKKKWEENFSEEPIAFFEVRNEEIKQMTLDFISHQEIDVLTMLTYKNNIFEGMFVPTYAKKNVSEFEIPILVIHA
ncbi:Nucleotide-binding universal stress protein, UspA family [Flavobacterium fluvii]|uniref:Nucleotide-binding universal stress protein, UspA family n=1 Tax=Flavobacterium fluvii TaxID=468056 RepID=A0A1M5HHV0_9FLAO|nr:universal stress protein [Flavobacterium fluvii]SHG15458.1 Nucleotide-binding universal stress protein, UspA family [Flavobacterium fluvii]